MTVGIKKDIDLIASIKNLWSTLSGKRKIQLVFITLVTFITVNFDLVSIDL